MGVFYKKILAASIALLTVSQGYAAALKLDLVIDGKPAQKIDVVLDGQDIGRSDGRGRLWFAGITGGRHTLRVFSGGDTVAYRFSVKESEAAFIYLAKDRGKNDYVKSIHYVPLEGVSVTRSDDGKVQKISVDTAVVVNGKISGIVTGESNTVIAGALVSVRETQMSTRTNRNGEYLLELPAGTHQLEITHPDYKQRVVTPVNVAAKLVVEMDILLPSGAEGGYPNSIEEVQVLGRARYKSPIDIERLATTSVLDAINFDEVKRFDDSTLSSALKRVVGVSLENNRFAIVRGMKSRYQSVHFNGAVLPSTDPARRDLPMDIFPTTVMQSLSVQKNASADIPGSATAAHIDMRSKQASEEAFLNMSMSFGYGDMHERDAMMVEGGDNDWLGIDDGFRDMPEYVQEVKGQYINTDVETPGIDRERLGESFNHYGIYIGDAQGDASLSLSGGKSWQPANQLLGFVGSFRYSNKWQNDRKINYDFGMVPVLDEYGKQVKNEDGSSAKKIGLVDASVTYDTNNIIDISGMLNFEWKINDNHQFGLNNLLLRHTTNSAEMTTSPTGYTQEKMAEGNWDPEQFPYDTSTESAKRQDIDWIEEQLFSHQLWGSHLVNLPTSLLGGLSLDWQVMTANTEYERPDAKRYTWFRMGAGNYEARFGDEQYSRWEKMEGENTGGRLDISLPITAWNFSPITLKTGLYRYGYDTDGYRYSYKYGGTSRSDVYDEYTQQNDPKLIFVDEIIVGSIYEEGLVSSTGGLNPDWEVGIDKGDHYKVEQEYDASYFSTEIEFWENLRATLGVRRESFSIAADQYYLQPEPLYGLLDESFSLPSVGLTYLFSDALQLRTAYSETVSWPETFEILPRIYRNIETMESYKGNPELKPAQIKNYDIRLEWYPAENESVTLAVFNKDMTNAIENRFDRKGDDYSYYTFANVDSGKVTGWELDARQDFTLYTTHELFAQLNYTDIESEVTLPPDYNEYDLNRPLQGQPDYIVNLQLGYDHIPTDQQITLVFNRKGRELSVVTPATGNNVSNVYSEPYNDLKLVYSKRFQSEFNVLVTVDNLLNYEKRYEYENTGGAPYLTYEPGTRYSVKVRYEF
ncbi:TonB-dependent receptor [Teredinibacter haidensis]|uniref:TonB-dependent receptor n=1 Tax=Teredinibacter haidensis TaxID=2731755 RepID=UPI000948F918|nr:TonB-dependent receptor [Teredinibacter haidensis]